MKRQPLESLVYIPSFPPVFTHALPHPHIPHSETKYTHLHYPLPFEMMVLMSGSFFTSPDCTQSVRLQLFCNIGILPEVEDAGSVPEVVRISTGLWKATTRDY